MNELLEAKGRVVIHLQVLKYPPDTFNDIGIELFLFKGIDFRQPVKLYDHDKSDEYRCC